MWLLVLDDAKLMAGQSSTIRASIFFIFYLTTKTFITMNWKASICLFSQILKCINLTPPASLVTLSFQKMVFIRVVNVKGTLHNPKGITRNS